jgi:hypothetical protein
MIFVESKTVTIAVADKPKSDFKKPIRLMPGKKRLSQRERFAYGFFYDILSRHK